MNTIVNYKKKSGISNETLESLTYADDTVKSKVFEEFSKLEDKPMKIVEQIKILRQLNVIPDTALFADDE